MIPFRPTIWQHRLLWVWNAGNEPHTTREWIAGNAQRLGFRTVVVKVHDGPAVFNGPQGDNSSQGYFDTLKRAGLIVGGWGWLTGDGEDTLDHGATEREAQRAAERCHTLGLSFYVADPESAYEFSPRDSPAPHDGNTRYGYSIRFVRAFAAAIRNPGFPRAVASFGRASLHDCDLAPWAHGSPDGYVWRNAMQAYANESHALSVELCVQDALKWWDRRFIHPTLGVYQGALGRHSPAEYQAELKRARVTGWGIYSLDSVTDVDLAGYGKVPV